MIKGYQNLTVFDNNSQLYVDAVEYNNVSYLLNIRRINVTVDVIHVLRVFVDMD